MTNVEKLILGYLLHESGTASVKELGRFSGVSESEVEEAIENLEKSFGEDSPIKIILAGKEASVSLAPEISEKILEVERKEKSGELSRASAETLAIVLYRPGATKSEIEYIRGVNSSYMLLSLQLRGLIRKEKTGAKVNYYPTTDTMNHLGIGKKEELPEWQEAASTLYSLFETKNEDPQ